MRRKTKRLAAFAVSVLMAGCLASPGTAWGFGAEGGPQRLYPTGVSASSTLAASSYGTYYAENLMDGDTSTAWVEGVSGQGVGEFVDFYFPAGTEITGGRIHTGYYKNDDIFSKNSAPSLISIQSGSNRQQVDLSYAAEHFDYSYQGTDFSLPEVVVSDGTVRVWIDGVRAGWKYEDTCISELYLYGYDNAHQGEGHSVDEVPQEPAVPESDPGENSESEESWIGGLQTDGNPYILGSGGQLYPVNEVLARDSDISDENRWRWNGFLHQLAHQVLSYEAASPLDLRTGDVSARAKALLLYWYLYHYQDSRVTESSDMMYHTTAKSSAWSMVEEMFGSVDQEVMTAFEGLNLANISESEYTVASYGDFGDAGAWQIGFPAEMRVENGRFRMIGETTSYDYNTGAQQPGLPYAAYFRYNASEPLYGWQFDELAIGDEMIAAADQYGAECYQTEVNGGTVAEENEELIAAGFQTDGSEIVIGPEENYPIAVVEDEVGSFSRKLQDRLMVFGNGLAHSYLGFDAPSSMDVQAMDVTPEARSTELYRYQHEYAEEDDRIRTGGDSWTNYSTRGEMEEILIEMFGDATEADLLTFEERSVMEISGDQYTMATGGSLGTSGSWGMADPDVFQIENGRLCLFGTLESYNETSGTWEKTLPYAMYFLYNRKEALLGWQFDELAIGEGAIGVAQNRGMELYQNAIADAGLSG